MLPYRLAPNGSKDEQAVLPITGDGTGDRDLRNSRSPADADAKCCARPRTHVDRGLIPNTVQAQMTSAPFPFRVPEASA
jgi:hypothetical protein